ncbi:MAG TPA: class I adenylate-forming enzyme family protein [Syntrophales bacterium]|nr:class I adenylate-forming enzyme family protein [Syntrophales bacterium]
MNRNIAQFLDRNIETYGEYEQFIFLGASGPQRMTNTEIRRQAQALAAGLRQNGVERGDIVCTVVSNVPEIPEIINGINRCGAVYLPVVFLLTAAEIRYILEDSGSKVIITEAMLLPKIREAAEGVATIRKIIVIGGETGGHTLAYADLLKDADATRGQLVAVEADDVAILMYTSGTTGVPKGVMITHRGMETQMRNGVVYTGCEYGSVVMVVVPMNHILGVLTCLEGNSVGTITYMMQPFDPRKVLDAIRTYKVEFIPLVPTMIVYLTMVFDPKKDDLSSMKMFISAGGPLSVETQEQAMKLFNADIRISYGCTETAGTITRSHHELPIKLGSAGAPIASMSLLVVDDNGREVPRGAEGEVICKGPMVMAGYLNKPKETADVLKDGWFYTGDVGRLDADGELYITGRKKDLIIKGGENIDPGVAEGLLYKHPAVMECAVVGMKDAKFGEEVAAAVTRKPGTETTEAELLAYLNQHLKAFMVPKRVFFFDALPKTGLGKILKREIRRIIDETPGDRG